MPLSNSQTDEYLAAIEQELRAILQPTSAVYADFFNMFSYHLGWTDEQGAPRASDPGKRVRPLICVWSCEATGGEWRNSLPAAAAIELVHNFSLIHDDIEDNSAERRGRATVWKNWGLAQGINAGDAMFVLAHIELDKMSADVSLATYMEIHRAFDAAIFELTQGQFLDLHFENANRVSLDDYLNMVRGKTAALLAAASEIGARISTDDPQLVALFKQFGGNLGIAFQIADDILGIWGDPAQTGKPVGADILSRKKSFPILAALQEDGQTDLREIIEKPALTLADVSTVEKILDKLGARGIAQTHAEFYLDRALAALDATDLDNRATARLRDLAFSAADREK